MKENGRVTTREFYEALLKIEPRLQKINERLKSLHEWAQGKNGIEKRMKVIDERIDAVENRHIKEDAHNQTLRTIGRIIQGIVYAVIALAAALIGKNWG